jgi:rhodanese-related sulfurtransferase
MAKQVILVILLILAALLPMQSRADDSHAMTKEQLKALLGNPDLTVIDVRTKYDWDTSKVKILGAVREESMKFSSWMNKYPKDKTIVLYCN